MAHDHQLRLVRNDPATLSFPGVMHSSAVPTAPFELLEEPMYHLDLLLRMRAERRRRLPATRPCDRGSWPPAADRRTCSTSRNAGPASVLR